MPSNSLSPRDSVLSSEQDKQESVDVEVLETTSTVSASEKKKKIGWIPAAVLLIVEAMAIGTFGIPSAFVALGMVWAVLLLIFFGVLAYYTSWLIGEVKIMYPLVQSYPDAVRLFGGRVGFEIASAVFVLLLILINGSHVLVGTNALNRIAEARHLCALVWGGVTAVIMFLLALPHNFRHFAILGYIDFSSLITALLIVLVCTGVDVHKQPGGQAAVEWSVWLPEDSSFSQIMLGVTNIIFAYAFSICQYSLMAEMHTPKDYMKSIRLLVSFEIVLYTFVGVAFYLLLGKDVQSPALLSPDKSTARAGLSAALPLVFISGAINTTLATKHIFDRLFGENIKRMKLCSFWMIWIATIAGLTSIAWMIAEAVPFFNALLGLISSLFISGFSFCLPAVFWFTIIKKDEWNLGWRNRCYSILNGFIFLLGVAILITGTYASVQDIRANYAQGDVKEPFACNVSDYRSA